VDGIIASFSGCYFYIDNSTLIADIFRDQSLVGEEFVTIEKETLVFNGDLSKITKTLVELANFHLVIQILKCVRLGAINRLSCNREVLLLLLLI